MRSENFLWRQPAGGEESPHTGPRRGDPEYHTESPDHPFAMRGQCCIGGYRAFAANSAAEAVTARGAGGYSAPSVDENRYAETSGSPNPASAAALGSGAVAASGTFRRNRSQMALVVESAESRKNRLLRRRKGDLRCKRLGRV
jgi:hypothetical protein